jgi:hypothetical protein
MFGSRDLSESSSEQRILVFQSHDSKSHQYFTSYGGDVVVESQWFKELMDSIEQDANGK